MQRPYVSICIFTYNRCENLSRCLASVFSQQEIHSGKVEIVVSDNASTDDTQRVCDEFKEKYTCFKYYRHSDVVPAGENLGYALSYGTGELLKLCKDTMVFLPGALAVLCNIVEKYIERKPLIWFSNGILSGCQYLVEEGHEPFGIIKRISYHITDVSHFSVWKENWLDLEHELSIIRGSDFGHVKKICECLSNNPEWVLVHNKIYNVALPLVKNVSYGIYNYFYKDFLSILNKYQQQKLFSAEAVAMIRYDMLFRFFPFWIFAGKYHYPQYRFSETEDLREAVFEAYKNEPYFSVFLKKFSALEDSLQIEYKRLYDFCLTAQRIYLFGTGEGTQVVKDYLDKNDIKIEGCMVSAGHKINSHFCGIPVYEVDEITADKSSLSIIVAVGGKLQREILQELKKRGYGDNVFVQKIFDVWNLE